MNSILFAMLTFIVSAHQNYKRGDDDDRKALISAMAIIRPDISAVSKVSGSVTIVQRKGSNRPLMLDFPGMTIHLLFPFYLLSGCLEKAHDLGLWAVYPSGSRYTVDGKIQLDWAFQKT